MGKERRKFGRESPQREFLPKTIKNHKTTKNYDIIRQNREDKEIKKRYGRGGGRRGRGLERKAQRSKNGEFSNDTNLEDAQRQDNSGK